MNVKHIFYLTVAVSIIFSLIWCIYDRTITTTKISDDVLSSNSNPAHTPFSVMKKIKPYMVPEYAINLNRPMLQSQEMNGKVYIYKLPTTPVVYVFTSSAAVDCDGQGANVCETDPTHLSETSFKQSDGKPLAPAILPWYVLPETPNPIFDYAQRDIFGGQVGAVIYGDNIDYGVFGDERGRDQGNSAGLAIGEVSYAMAELLGIPSKPSVGGVGSGVTYIVFTTKGNVVTQIENHTKAETMGENALDLLLSQI
jgi:hypothetical protein